MSKKGEIERLRPFNWQWLEFGAEFHNEQWVVLSFGGEVVLGAIALLLAVEQYFPKSTQVRLVLPRNRKGLEKHHESRVLSGK